jgi:hypothetical protein
VSLATGTRSSLLPSVYAAVPYGMARHQC